MEERLVEQYAWLVNKIAQARVNLKEAESDGTNTPDSWAYYTEIELYRDTLNLFAATICVMKDEEFLNKIQQLATESNIQVEEDKVAPICSYTSKNWKYPSNDL